MTFALTNMKHHTLAIEIAHLQSAKFLSAQSRSVQGHQNYAMARGSRRFDQLRHFLFAQDHWESFRAFRVDQIDVPITVGEVP
jgi:hypothetical protein